MTVLYDTNNYQPQYGGTIASDGTVKNIADAITGTGANTKLKVDASLSVQDVQIGAVEVKDSATDNRLAINANGFIGVYIVGSIDGGTW